MTKYLKRTDVEEGSAAQNLRRNYLVKVIEADSHTQMQSRINIFLLALPLFVSPKTTISLEDVEFQIDGNGNNRVYTAMITLYFVGLEFQLDLPP